MKLEEQKILVTGGAGFLGKHIVEALMERGVPRENIIVPRSKDCDLRIWENCEKIMQGVNLVIHAAAVTGGSELHRKEPGRIFYDNLVMGVHLMEAARRAGVEKFVVIGSATEYPENTPVPCKEKDFWDGLPEELHAPYALAKKMLLVQAQAYEKQYGFKGIHLLMTNMYGPGDAKIGTVIPTMAQRIWEAKRDHKPFIEVWGAGKAVRDFLYVEDAARGIILALEKYNKSEPVNIGSGKGVSIRELAELLARLLDFKGELRFDPSKPEGQVLRVVDTRRAEKEFGFKASTELEAGLEATIKSYLITSIKK